MEQFLSIPVLWNVDGFGISCAWQEGIAVCPCRVVMHKCIAFHPCWVLLFLCCRSVRGAAPACCGTAPGFWGASCLPASHCSGWRGSSSPEPGGEGAVCSCWERLQQRQSPGDKAPAPEQRPSHGAGCKFWLWQLLTRPCALLQSLLLHVGPNGPFRASGKLLIGVPAVNRELAAWHRTGRNS